MSDLLPAPTQPPDRQLVYLSEDGLPIYQTVYILERIITERISSGIEQCTTELVGQVFIREARAIAECAVMNKIATRMWQHSTTKVEYTYRDYTAT